MRQTEDIAPLVDIADREFNRLSQDAYNALIALHGFWSKLYGPNEALSGSFEELDAMVNEWTDDAAATREP